MHIYAGPARASNAKAYIDEQRCKGHVARCNWSTSHVNNSHGCYIRRYVTPNEGAGVSAPNTRAEDPSSRGIGRRGHRRSKTPLAGVTQAMKALAGARVETLYRAFREKKKERVWWNQCWQYLNTST